MSKTIEILLYLAALICFIVAAFVGWRASAQPGGVVTRINLIALGLMFWVLVPFLTLVLG